MLWWSTAVLSETGSLSADDGLTSTHFTTNNPQAKKNDVAIHGKKSLQLKTFTKASVG